MTSGDVWPGEEEETAEVKPAREPVRDEGRSEAIRKNARRSGQLQVLATLEVAAAIDRLALVLKDALGDSDE